MANLGDMAARGIPVPTGKRTLQELIDDQARLPEMPVPPLVPPRLLATPTATPPGPEASEVPPAPGSPVGLPSAAPLPEAPAAAPDLSAALAAAAKVGPDVRTSSVQPTKQFQQIRQDLNKLDTQRQATADQLTKHNVQVAGEVYKDEQQNERERLKLQTDLAAERAKVESQKAAAVKYEKDLREKNAKDYERSFFEERGTARSIGIALSVGLGALGQGLAAAGGVRIDNVAWDITQKLMDQHAAREKGRLLKEKEEIERAGGDVTRIDQQLRDFDTITRPHREAALLANFEQRRKVRLAKHGATKEQIEGDAVKQRLEAERLQREAGLEQALFKRVETDNSEQNKLRRQHALGAGSPAGVADKADDKLTEAERKAQGALNGTLTAAADAQKFQYTAKDKKVVDAIVAASRNVEPSDPTKFWASLSQIRGKHYDQLSAAGKQRFDRIYRAAQNQERILSGAVISPHEIADVFGATKEPGSERLFFQRTRDLLPATGQPNRYGAEVARREQQAFGGQGGAPQAVDQRQAVQNAATAAQLLRTTTDPKNREALEWVRANPGNEAAAAVLAKVRGQ